MGKYYYKVNSYDLAVCVEQCPIDANSIKIGSAKCSECEYCEKYNDYEKYVVCPHLVDNTPLHIENTEEPVQQQKEDLLQEIIDIINESDFHVPVKNKITTIYNVNLTKV